MKRVSGPSPPASTRATIRSTRLQLAAPSKNSLKRRALPSFGAASKRAFVLASRPSMCRRCRDDVALRLALEQAVAVGEGAGLRIECAANCPVVALERLDRRGCTRVPRRRRRRCSGSARRRRCPGSARGFPGPPGHGPASTAPARAIRRRRRRARCALLAVVFEDCDLLRAKRSTAPAGSPANNRLLPPPSTSTGPSRNIA